MKRSKHSWGFDTRDMDKRVRPQDDFYHHANGGWLKRNSIPANESRWGSFVILRRNTDLKLHRILKEVDKPKNIRHGSIEQLVRDFYRSGMDEETRARRGVKPLEPYRRMIREITNRKSALECLAKLHRIGTGGFWGLLIEGDWKDSRYYSLYLVQNGLSMPDRDYYLNDDAESKRVRTAYQIHLRKLWKLVGKSDQDAERASEIVMNVERRLARASMRKEDTRDVDKTYHKKSLKELIRLAPQIDWARYFKLIDMSRREVVLAQPEFLAFAARLFATLPFEDLKTYLEWHLINDFAGYLSPAFVRQSFSFYGTALTGMKKMRPLWRRALGIVNVEIGEALGKLYVKRHFTKEAKREMNMLVDHLFAAYEKRIKALDWMGTSTKRKAIAKLHAMGRKIGYPSRWRSYRGLSVKPRDLFGNVVRANEFWHRYQMKKLKGRKVDRSEWGMTPQTVNAYCSFEMNEIVFPAAILQSPFFDMRADDAFNYGAIGTVIGHEITHGFDDQGSKFDGKGNRKAWWTKRDRQRFDAKARVVRKQFDRYRVEGLPVNGQLTLGENIADLGGASIAFDAYQAHLARTGRRTIGPFTPEQRFFLGFALFERELTRPEGMKTRILTDPHAPSISRINGPASNLPEFYEAFGVKKSDKLYRATKERAKIW